MNLDAWNFHTWQTFQHKITQKLLTNNDIIENGTHEFYQEIYTITNNTMQVIRIDPPQDRTIIKLQKNNKKYLLPARYEKQLPIKPGPTTKCQLKPSDKKIWELITSPTSLKITPELRPKSNLKKFIADWNPQTHTNPSHWTLLKAIMIASVYKSVKLCVCSPPSCVDGETEFLTPYGWKKIREYEQGDEVLQYHRETGIASYTKPIQYIDLPCDEGMYHIQTKYTDQMLTPDHTVLYAARKHTLIKTAEELVKTHNKTKNGFSGNFLHTFKPFTEKEPDFGLNDAELRLMVAVIADGTFTNEHNNHTIVRIKKEHKKERLRTLLRHALIDYNENPQQGEYSHFSFYSPMKFKEYGWRFWTCSEDQIRLIAEEVVCWDGNRKDTFYTTSKQSADFIQYCFASTGHRASINTLDRRGQKRGKYTRKSIEYTVKRNNLKTSSLHNPHGKNQIELVQPQDGRKYCFTVPSGFLVLRRNDKIFVTGNCGKNSNFTILGHITGEVCRIQKPTTAKLETVLYYNNVVLPDEITSMSKTDIEKIESIVLNIGDNSTEYNKHSMAKDSKLNTVDLTRLSIIFTYNRVQDIRGEGDFFDDKWANKNAFRSRYPQLLLKGTITTSPKNHSKKQASKIMENNFGDMRGIAKELEYWRQNIPEHMHNWNRDGIDLPPRHKSNMEGLLDVLDALSDTQAEYDYWLGQVESAIRDYKTMLTGEQMEEPIEDNIKLGDTIYEARH